MTLRMRIFLLLGGMLAALVLAEWLLVRTLARDLEAEAGNVALHVGESVFTLFGLAEGEAGDTSSAPAEGSWHPAQGAERTAATGTKERRVFVLRSDSESAVGTDGTDAPSLPGSAAAAEARRLEPHVLAALREIAAAHAGDAPTAAEVLGSGVVVLRGDAALRALGSDLPPAAAEAVRQGAAVRVEMSVDAAHPHFLQFTGPEGLRRIPIPRAGIEAALDTFRRRLLLGTLALLAIGIVAAAVIAHRVSQPLRSLAGAAREVGEGELGTQVDVPASGEVGEAIAAFNAMSRRLAELDATTTALREREHLGEIGEIARGLAHGLRSPLHALGLSVDELGTGGGDAPSRSALAESARRQLRRVDAALRSLLALGAAREGGAPPTPVDVGALVEDVVLEALQDARGRVRLEAVVPEGLPRVMGVSAELRAALQALVVNAVEASPDGGGVVVRARVHGATGARIEVEDEGPGLTDEVRARLFTPHVTTKAHGTGMGLFLAHRLIAERHGGRIELRPREGGGTRAIIDLQGEGGDRG